MNIMSSFQKIKNYKHIHIFIYYNNKRIEKKDNYIFFMS